MRRSLACLSLLCVAACMQTVPEPPPAPPEVAAPAPAPSAPAPAGAALVATTPLSAVSLTADGWGPLRIGMTRAEITRAVGGDADPQAVGGPEPESCDQFRPARTPEGMLLMVEAGRLTRISLVRDSKVPTDRGLRLGVTAAEVAATYGAGLLSEPHKYQDSPARYLTAWRNGAPGGAGPVVENPAARGIRYEIGQSGRVEAIHAGGPAIEYVEGCL